MARRIVLFGATGYTGRLTAEAFVARGARPVLAARSEDKLRRLAEELGGDLETAPADVNRPESVRALVDEGDVLVSTVGPFARFGSPAVEAAIAAKAIYVDSTGEPPFIRRVFERWDGPARDAGASLLTAFGYDWVPGNLAGALALREAGEAATRVVLGYFITGRGGFSGGTRASAAGALVESGFAYIGGQLVTERPAARVHSFQVRGRSRPAISVASSEHFALPRVHPSLQDVDAYLGWFGAASRPMQGFSLMMSGITRVPGVRGGLDAVLGRMVKGSTGGPSREERAAAHSHVVAFACDSAGTQLAEVRLEGVNGYDFTAGMLAWAAMRAAEQGVHGTGALGPVEAFGLDDLEAGAAEAGISTIDS